MTSFLGTLTVSVIDKVIPFFLKYGIIINGPWGLPAVPLKALTGRFVSVANCWPGEMSLLLLGSAEWQDRSLIESYSV